MMIKEDISGIILAGGRSSRLGTEKGLVMLAGKELITYPIGTLSTLALHILIGSNNAEYTKFGHPVIPDLVASIGPMGGLYSCLNASSTDMNLVLSCDMPFVPPQLMDHLLGLAGDAEVVLPTLDGLYPEPMCGLYRRSVLGTMEQFIAQGRYKLADFFQEVRFRMVRLDPQWPFYSGLIMANINTPEDLKEAEKVIRKNLFIPYI